MRQACTRRKTRASPAHPTCRELAPTHLSHRYPSSAPPHHRPAHYLSHLQHKKRAFLPQLALWLETTRLPKYGLRRTSRHQRMRGVIRVGGGSHDEFIGNEPNAREAKVRRGRVRTCEGENDVIGGGGGGEQLSAAAARLSANRSRDVDERAVVGEEEVMVRVEIEHTPLRQHACRRLDQIKPRRAAEAMRANGRVNGRPVERSKARRVGSSLTTHHPTPPPLRGAGERVVAGGVEERGGDVARGEEEHRHRWRREGRRGEEGFSRGGGGREEEEGGNGGLSCEERLQHVKQQPISFTGVAAGMAIRMSGLKRRRRGDGMG